MGKSIVIPQGQDSVVRISAKKRGTVALPSSMTVWGKITGDINDQADLKACLDDIWKYAKKNRKLAKAAL